MYSKLSVAASTRPGGPKLGSIQFQCEAYKEHMSNIQYCMHSMISKHKLLKAGDLS